MRKFTKEEIKKLKDYWKAFKALQEDFDFKVHLLENLMQVELEIEDLEFFGSDDGICGIGNISRTIKLIQWDDLER